MVLVMLTVNSYGTIEKAVNALGSTIEAWRVTRGKYTFNRQEGCKPCLFVCLLYFEYAVISSIVS